VSIEQLQLQRYTYADYLTWADDVRQELIDGIPYLLAAPTVTHQRVLGELFLQLRQFLKGKRCEVFISPFDVRLNPNDGDDTVVQPDLLVVCDKSKLDKKGCKGAPDMIIEILSPSSTKMDKFIKMRKYNQAGVREYWIVDPEGQYAHVHLLKDGEYKIAAYSSDDTAVPVAVLDGCEINLADVFASIDEQGS